MKAHNSVFNHFAKSFGGVSAGHRAEIQSAQSGGEKLVGKRETKKLSENFFGRYSEKSWLR